MQLLKATAVAILAFLELTDAVPSPYWTKQHLINDPKAAVKAHNPYAPDYSDPYDHKVDSIGEKLDPLPYRGKGEGTSVLGPWNRERSRQNPDLVRPPSTDSGVMQNMRWSFADSHVRIGVRLYQFATKAVLTSIGKLMDPPNYSQRASEQQGDSRCQYASRSGRHS